MARALVGYLGVQKTIVEGREDSLFAGIFAIFGHGNVAGLGQALAGAREQLPTLRAHNEQAMAHAAIAFAKASNRRRMMACTTSIGPGATNLVTAAALAHVNRLPVLLLPGDAFANRRPDPVLQQIEDFGDPNVTANDCLRPVSRYWDRITRPEQLLSSLPAAMRVLTDPAECGPVTLALPQDVQAEAYDYPVDFFSPRVHRWRRPGPDRDELRIAADLLAGAKQPLIIAGGGVHYSLACEALLRFAHKHAIPVAETQAGKGALPWNHPMAAGAIGVTGGTAANQLAARADVVLAVGSRLSDFTTASRSLFQHPEVALIGLNVAAFDAGKHGSAALVCDAERGLDMLSTQLGDYRSPAVWQDSLSRGMEQWNQVVDRVTAAPDEERTTGDPDNTVARELPSDAQVLGAVNRRAGPSSIVVCAAGGLPGELHKLWRTPRPGGYHLEYGYSCMGYEIAGGMGVKMARPDSEVYVLVGDGSYLMLNSEIATSVMLGHKLIIVILDNRGFGCINRLQRECGGESFNNLFEHVATGEHGVTRIDFAAHAAALGARSEKVSALSQLDAALQRARASDRTYAIVIDTDPLPEPYEGGAWWDVPVAEVSPRRQVNEARKAYEKAIIKQRIR
ncbi:MAG: 3D-(3,5/4)-trihydroxycyclohexane-1,2-dione acylhydrolase (decyclizing) [Proteobacteria bacterium]|nr:3D-(3,5/4)-trihydroxycyclohexane-1,2-dione acylhydrolase (decyclizing) [Pseudomonadota bacterium]